MLLHYPVDSAEKHGGLNPTASSRAVTQSTSRTPASPPTSSAALTRGQIMRTPGSSTRSWVGWRTRLHVRSSALFMRTSCVAPLHSMPQPASASSLGMTQHQLRMEPFRVGQAPTILREAASTSSALWWELLQFWEEWWYDMFEGKFHSMIFRFHHFPKSYLSKVPFAALNTSNLLQNTFDNVQTSWWTCRYPDRIKQMEKFQEETENIILDTGTDTTAGQTLPQERRCTFGRLEYEKTTGYELIRAKPYRLYSRREGGITGECASRCQADSKYATWKKC